MLYHIKLSKDKPILTDLSAVTHHSQAEICRQATPWAPNLKEWFVIHGVLDRDDGRHDDVQAQGEVTSSVSITIWIKIEPNLTKNS